MATKVKTTKDSVDLESRLKRALADYQNLEKRISVEKESFVKFANSSLIANLLPSLEILEKAAFHSQDPGVKMALDQFRQALLDEGLEEIAPQPGDAFDHQLHECIETVESEGKADSVAELVSKGYRFKDGLVLKPAKVKVFKGLENFHPEPVEGSHSTEKTGKLENEPINKSQINES